MKTFEAAEKRFFKAEKQFAIAVANHNSKSSKSRFTRNSDYSKFCKAAKELSAARACLIVFAAEIMQSLGFEYKEGKL